MKLQDKYKKEIIAKLKEEFGYKNNLEVPKIDKVVLNSGFGRNAKDKVFVDNVVNSLERISGQKPITLKAKRSISSFKVRQGMIIGSKVTLRGKRMWNFLDKLVNLVFANIRDFRGIESAIVDRDGNITIGFRDHIAFPEIRNDEVDRLHGLEVCVSTTTKNSKEGLRLFELLGFPFKK
ncbi:50S ribosomal protein L5 [Patescibacteria group bacterium]|nr:50S ribosomal protein L5 [Patescibacteria group bacterium]